MTLQSVTQVRYGHILHTFHTREERNAEEHTDSEAPGRPDRADNHPCHLHAVLHLGTWHALADEGSFHILRSLERDYTTVDHGSVQFIGGTLKGTGTVLWSSGAPFVEGAHFTVSCVVLVRTSPGGVDLQAPCLMTDGEEDRLYAAATRRAGDIQAGGGGQGQLELLGGTDKYAGIAGSCSYETAYLPDGYAVSLSKCSWHRVAE